MHHFPTAVNISFLVSPPQTISKWSTLRDQFFGARLLSAQQGINGASFLTCTTGLPVALQCLPRALQHGIAPFALAHHDAVSTPASVTITELKGDLGFTTSSASLCVVWGRKGICVQCEEAALRTQLSAALGAPLGTAQSFAINPAASGLVCDAPKLPWCFHRLAPAGQLGWL